LSATQAPEERVQNRTAPEQHQHEKWEADTYLLCRTAALQRASFIARLRSTSRITMLASCVSSVVLSALNSRGLVSRMHLQQQHATRARKGNCHTRCCSSNTGQAADEEAPFRADKVSGRCGTASQQSPYITSGLLRRASSTHPEPACTGTAASQLLTVCPAASLCVRPAGRLRRTAP
jgi:hypothetical protein